MMLKPTRAGTSPAPTIKRFLSLFALTTVFIAGSSSAPQLLAQKRKKTRATKASAASVSTNAANIIDVRTEPNAIVWLDEVRRGTTNAAGQLTIWKVAKVPGGRHMLRVRASGFKEASLPWIPGRGNAVVRLVRTTDEAELTFQQAEEAREKARDDGEKEKAARLYRRALELRPTFAAAHVGLARVLLDQNDYRGALAEISLARRARPVYPEASAVEGRIQRAAAFENEAIESYQRAISEGRGFQPEAHTGLAIVLEDKGKLAEAAEEFSKAIAQLSDTEPVLYQLLGAVYEKQEKYREAVAAYEKYLALAPEGSLAPAIRSVIDQLRREAAGQGLSPE
ncbi:MAG TPA: tetratricopeptide repeat protein [Pyrinomonadaceae bacterium]|jgi:Flp pilus assembly protein TadD|nr:tetratricopeptide repeat protein [Pyrinomonadaceae bacterium]